MDIESHESALLLKESSPKRRQGLALKLAVMLCGLALLVNLNGPTDTNIGVTFSSNKEEKKVTAAAGSSSPRPAASTMNMMDWRAAAVAAPAWSVEDNDTTRTPFGVACRGGGFRQMTMAMGIARGIGADTVSGASGGGTGGAPSVDDPSPCDATGGESATSSARALPCCRRRNAEFSSRTPPTSE